MKVKVEVDQDERKKKLKKYAGVACRLRADTEVHFTKLNANVRELISTQGKQKVKLMN